MKYCIILLSLVLLNVSFAIGQVLTPQYVNPGFDFNQNEPMAWEEIDLSIQKEWKYPSVSSDYPTVSLIVSFQDTEGLKYKTCKNHSCTPLLPIKPDLDLTDDMGNLSHKALIFPDQLHDKIVFEYTAKKGISPIIKLALRYFSASHSIEKTIVSSRNCICNPLSFKNRVQWNCPDTEESSLFVPEYTKHTHVVIHHQAGSANPPYDNVVRAIWDYHVNGNGWSDIGYNWLIAPDGTIYKGRSWLNGDQNVRGAHTCSCNSNKLGVCLLGNLTANLPTAAQYQSLKNFIVWKACELEILPDIASTIVSSKSGECIEEFVHHITGHRDNCGTGYTACPGDRFYPELEALRSEVIEDYYNCIDTLNTASSDLLNNLPSKFYPNPNDGRFDIDIAEHSSVIIYNTFGQIMEHYTLNPGRHRITARLNAGSYILSIRNIKSTTNHKMEVR